MDASKLFLFKQHDEIISLTEKAAPFGGEIWQATLSGRQIVQIIQMNVNLECSRIILRTFGSGEIDPQYPLYIHLCYRSLIFKLLPHEYKVIGDRVICHYPSEVKALQIRKGDRYILPGNSDISLSIKRNIRTLTEIVFELEVRIADVSEYGFGILISGNNRDFFKRLDHFAIKAIDHKILSSPLNGRVSYVAPKGHYLRRGEVRVGLCLENPLSWEFFNYLKKKCHTVLSA